LTVSCVGCAVMTTSMSEHFAYSVQDKPKAASWCQLRSCPHLPVFSCTVLVVSSCIFTMKLLCTSQRCNVYYDISLL